MEIISSIEEAKRRGYLIMGFDPVHSLFRVERHYPNTEGKLMKAIAFVKASPSEENLAAALRTAIR